VSRPRAPAAAGPYARPFKGRALDYDRAAVEHGIGMGTQSQLTATRDELLGLEAKAAVFMRAIREGLGEAKLQACFAEAAHMAADKRALRNDMDVDEYDELGGDEYDGPLGRPARAESASKAPEEKKRTGGRVETYTAPNAQQLFGKSFELSLLRNPDKMAEIREKYQWDGKRYSLGAEAAQFKPGPGQEKAKPLFLPGGTRPTLFMDIVGAEWKRLKEAKSPEVGKYEKMRSKAEAKMKLDWAAYQASGPEQREELLRKRKEAQKAAKAKEKEERDALRATLADDD
jgi:hypothetical protein